MPKDASKRWVAMSEESRTDYESRATFEEFQRTLEQIERVRKGITAEPVAEDKAIEQAEESANTPGEVD